MIHKIFQWLYLRNRSSYGSSYKKIDRSPKDRDLVHYFHDFGGDGQNAQGSHWLKKKIFKLFCWILFLVFATWFSYQSYLGLLIYDN